MAPTGAFGVGMESLRKNYAGRQSALEVQRLQAYTRRGAPH